MNIDFNAGKKNIKVSDDEDREEEIEDIEEVDLSEGQDGEIEIEETKSPKKISFDDNDFKKKLIKVGGLIIGIFLVFLLIIFIATMFTKTKYSYEEVEQVMKEAAISFFNEHPTSLPKSGNIVTIPVDRLVDEGKMKPLEEYLGNEVSCKGSVDVENTDGNYVYTPYLNCGDSYETVELYKKIIKEDNIVTSGYGLYAMNGEYVYRGENVDNYVKLKNNLWRIVKVKSDNTIELILADNSILINSWDDRYNRETEFESGINNYATSRMRELLNSIYNKNYTLDDGYEPEEYEFVSDSDKEKLVSFDACVGKRTDGETSKNNSVECSEKLNNQYIALLTASDYLNASLDENCTNTTNKSCGNYNYLKNNQKYWILTANKMNSTKVYIVDADGSLVTKDASDIYSLRPVILLKENTFFKSGKGTLNKPYKVK